MPDSLPPIVNPPNSPPPAKSDGVLHSRPLILGVLFGVTGVLGLPLLWYSPVFTRGEKVYWSVINTLYTLGLLAMAIAGGIVIMRALSQLP